MARVHQIRQAIFAGVFLVAAAFAAVPIAAQIYSDGFKFLEAVEKKDRATVIQLIHKNVTVIDSRDISKGHTALHIAVKRRDLAWIDYLLGLNANPNIADKAGVTPLILASQMGYVEAVSLLAGRGARVDVANNAGETPLISAIHRRDIAMVRVLLKAGADPERADNSGRSARDYAKLDVQGGQMLQEMDRLSNPAEKEKSARVYGPSF